MKKKGLQFGLALLLSSAMFMGCSKKSFEEAAISSQQNSDDNTIGITSTGYSKAVLWVGKDIPVTWINGDNRVHSVTSDNGYFDSGPIQPGASFTYTFTLAGAYDYHDNYSSAKATIDVVGRN